MYWENKNVKLEALFEKHKAQDHLSDHNCTQTLRALYRAFPNAAVSWKSSFLTYLYNLALIGPHILSEVPSHILHGLFMAAHSLRGSTLTSSMATLWLDTA